MTARPAGSADRDHDRARVRELLGREPQGDFDVVVRDATGDPVVIRNAPLLDDGTPMPTRYWLVGPDEVRRVGQLESTGGVAAAERAVDPAELAAAHDRYAVERDATIAPDHTGPRPAGGVGGTRTGVKCLHAHWAWHLAGGDDPVARWIADQFATSEHRPGPTGSTASMHVTVAGDQTVFVVAGGEPFTVPWGPVNLTDRWLAAHDPPRPEDLTNALGTVDDHLDDLVRERPGAADVADVACAGAAIAALAGLEIGTDDPPSAHVLTREAAEEVFRTVATEPTTDRAHNPGLPSRHVETIIATCCLVLALMRRLHLAQVTLEITDA